MKRKLLVVDDIDINRVILRKILENEYEVLEAVNGLDALNVLRRERAQISAVLLDLAMPQMDGFEMLQHLRNDPDLSIVPVIVTTGRTDLESEVKALSLGASDFIVKPYNSTVISHRIGNTIRLRETAALINASKRDELTGLYNRKAFFKEAEVMIARHEPGHYVMSCFDIDSFKVVNDQYGTDKGDEVLRHVANCVSTCVDSIGGICCRVTADNFAMLYPSVYMDSSLVSQNHTDTTAPACIKRPIAIRIGRYIVDDLSLSASAMYDRASLAKSSIKGRYDRHIALYRESMREHLLHEQKIVTEMNDALRGGQFEIWLQPQYNHMTGALIGAEALARWRHPVNGLLIPPGDFIPVFERNGFVYDLDKYIWEQACMLLRQWMDEGQQPLPISVNISRYDLFRDDFYAVITGLVERYGVPAELLRLEITESAFAKSSEQIIFMVKQLIDYGFTVEIDDFGSGYSSLNTLKDVPATILKLDMKFLETTGDSRRGGNILESIVRMAKWLGMSVIAEGVETRAQADYLKSIGCFYVQGYLYAQPMCVRDYETLARSLPAESRMTQLETLKSLDNDAFWNPASMETLIFSSYVGGACIFEQRKEGTEILRINDNYVKEMGIRYSSGDLMSVCDPVQYLDTENQQILSGAVTRAIQSRDEVACEVRLTGINGDPDDVFIRAGLRLLAQAGDQYLLYCTILNMTAQRKAERDVRKTAEQLDAIMSNIIGGVTATVFKAGPPQFLYANQQYYAQLGYTEAQFRAEVSSAFELIVPDDRARVMSQTLEANTTRLPQTIIYRITRRDGEIRWIQSNLSVIQFPDEDLPVQLAVANDITAQRLAEQQIRETDEHLRFLNATAHDLLALPDIEKGLNHVLNNLLEYFAGDRAYIMELDADREITVSTYEVCVDGVNAVMEDLQTIPFTLMQDWFSALESRDFYSIADIDTLDDSRAEERAFLKAQGIRSLVAVSLRRDGRLIGIMGIDNPRRQGLHITRMAALGDYIAVMLTRRDLTNQARSDSGTLTTLMNDTPGGFCRIHIGHNTHASIVYVNDGLCRLLGLSHEQVMALYGNDAISVVHPDDRDALTEAYRAMQGGSDQSRSKCRMRHGTEGYVWVTVFSRLTMADNGERYVNAYFTDMSEQAKIDQLRQDLIENLPCGAGIYIYENGKLRLTYVNQRYLAFIGRQIGNGNLEEAPVIEVVHPDDREKLLCAFNIALTGSGQGACDIRIRDGASGYIPFHVAGSIADKSDGRAVIYVTYTPIPQQELTLRETLPFILSAMMEESTDIMFAKDKDLRYICCSRGFADIAGVRDVQDAVGKTDYDLFGPEFADIFYNGDEQLRQTGRPLIDKIEHLPSHDGVTHYGKLSKYPLYDTAGNIIGLYGIGRDITEARSNLEQLNLLINTIPGGLATYEAGKDHLRLLYCSDGYANHTGYSTEEYRQLTKEHPLGLVSETDLPRVRATVQAVLAGDQTFRYEYRCRSRDGKLRWIDVRGVVVERHGDTVMVNLVKFDITERKLAEEQLRMSEEQYRIAQTQSGNVICRYDVASRTITMAPDIAAIFHLPVVMANVPDEIVRQGNISLESVDAYTRFFEGILQGQKTGTAEFNMRIKNGWRWMKAVHSTIFSDDGKPVSAIISFNDVTEQHRQAREHNALLQSERILQRRAQTDGLTGILNRATVEAQVRRQIGKASGAPFTLIIADLDDLKTINDTLGHPQGDRAVKLLAQALETHFRQTDLVGRIGGDEFLVLLDGVNEPEKVRGTIQALTARIAQYRIGAQDDTPFSVSIGIVPGYTGRDSFDTLYQKADRALYYAKRNGKNQYAFYSSETEGD